MSNLGNFCKLFYLPVSIKMRCFCIHVMNDFGLCRGCNLRLAWLWADPPILSCAEKISNQNGFGTVNLLLLNVHWDLDWDLRILLQDWPLKSAQKWYTISRQFLRILQFKQTLLFECLRLIHEYALSLLFHLKSWFAQKLNYATAFARVYKQYYTAKCKHYFCLDRVSHAMFSARFTVKC